MNEGAAVPMTLDGLRVFLRQPNLEQMVCSVAVTGERRSRPSDSGPVLKRCKWKGCMRIGEQNLMTAHEDACAEREVRCKWPTCDKAKVTCTIPNCNRELPHKEMLRHESHCKFKLVACIWKKYRKQVVASKMQNHEATCKYRAIKCRWPNCKKVLPFNETASHQERCGKRVVACRFADCKVECLFAQWDRHVARCQHVYARRNCCWVSECVLHLFPPALAAHLHSAHPTDVVVGAKAMRTYRKGPDSTDRVYFQYDGRLLWGWSLFEVDGNVAFYLMVCGADEARAEYKCAIKVFQLLDVSQTITVNADCDAYTEISADILRPFVQNDRINCEWTLMKK